MVAEGGTLPDADYATNISWRLSRLRIPRHRLFEMNTVLYLTVPLTHLLKGLVSRGREVLVLFSLWNLWVAM